jgi:predicted O-methyltransferase YrrM
MAFHYLSIDGWFDFGNIYELALRRAGSKRAQFVEVGAYKGRSSCYMAERIRETGSDVSFDVVDTFCGDTDVGRGDLWPEFAANLERAGVLASVRPCRAASVQAATAYPDELLDFVFIDAAHSFEAVTADLAGWWPKLRPGGLIAGHDYTHSPGVRAAVDRFVAARGLGRAFRADGSSWMIYRSAPIDAAYCLNLPRRPDRRRRAAAQFEAAGLAARVAFFDAVDGAQLSHPGRVSDGQAGCGMSHLAVLREARERGHAHVLVFEDDVELVPDFALSFEAALARCPASYDLCYAGAICCGAWGNYLYPFDDLLARVGSVSGTHAYIVNLAAYLDIEAGLHGLENVIDNWYAHTLQPRGNCYVCTPYLAFQSTGYSDVAKAHNANGAYRDYVWR